MNKNCHPNYLTAGHTILTLLKSGATITWDDGTAIEPVLNLNIILASKHAQGGIMLSLHFSLDLEGVNNAMEKLAEWRRWETHRAKR